MKNGSQALISVFGVSDIGCVRKLNEDNFSLWTLASQQMYPEGYHGHLDDAGFLMFVCDGSGGDGRGKVASHLATEVFPAEVINANSTDGWGNRLIAAAIAANNRVWREARNKVEMTGMAATLTSALVVPPLAYIIEVGDSRCYLIRGRTLKQVTRDQSMVQTLIDSGVLTPQAAITHPYRNIVLQSLGASDSVVPVITSLELAQGDRLLLCSDGLSKNLPEHQIIDIIAANPDVQVAANKLIEAANALDADDNITAIVAAFAGNAFAQPESLAMVLSEVWDECRMGEELEDVTDFILPVE